MALRQEMVYVRGKEVVVNHLTGDARDTVPLVVAMLKGVPPGHAGLGGTNSGNIYADTTNFLRSDVMGRICKHGDEEYRYSNLIGIIRSSSSTTMTNWPCSAYWELGDKLRGNHKLCRTQSTESDFFVALEREGLSPGTFSNVNSYGDNVVSKLLP